MAARTESDIETELAAVNTEISAIVANTDRKALDYSIDGITFNKSKRLRELRALRKDLLAELATLPCEEETVVDEPFL